MFVHRRPRPPLDSAIASIWLFRRDPRPFALERVLPTGAAQLIVNLKEDETRLYDADRPHQMVANAGAILTGVQSQYQVIDTSEQEYVAGVAFKPGGTVPFVKMPASEAADMDVPLEALWGACRTAVLRERLLASGDGNARSTSSSAHSWKPGGPMTYTRPLPSPWRPSIVHLA